LAAINGLLLHVTLSLGPATAMQAID